MSQASNLTSVSIDAAAVLRWSGMSSWVWEWIPAGWNCHSGWRHSEQNVWELWPNDMVSDFIWLNMRVEPWLTIPVRSSNNKAPRLHQSHASVTLDTPPISVNIQWGVLSCIHAQHFFIFPYNVQYLVSKVDQLNLATRWQVTPRNNHWFLPTTACIFSPGAQYICSMALEQISDWTSLHWPKNVKHTFPVITWKCLIKIKSIMVVHMQYFTSTGTHRCWWAEHF